MNWMNDRTIRTKYPNKGVRVYQELVKAFIEVDRVAFSAILQEHAKLFHDDGNMGMARQAEAVLLHRLVYQISSMYAVISQEQLIGGTRTFVRRAAADAIVAGVDEEKMAG